MEKVHQGFDLVRLENIAERRHRRAAVTNLKFNFLFVQAFADGAQIRTELSSAAIYAVAMLTSFLVKERSP